MSASNYPRPLDVRVAAIVAQLSPNRREAFEERAAIREMDGMLDRIDAEREALLDIIVGYSVLGSTPVCLLRAKMHGTVQWFLTIDADAAMRRLAERGALDVTAVDLVQALMVHFGGTATLLSQPADAAAST